MNQGWLDKKSKLGFWNRRFFVLKNGKLIGLVHPSSPKYDFKMILTSETDVQIIEKSTYKFIVTVPNVSNIILRADDKDSMMKWIMDIREAVFTRPQLSIKLFNIIAVIGRGFFGKVMLCERKDTKEILAVKSVRKNKLLTNDRVKSIFDERAIMIGSRNHPFLIGLRYAFQSKSKFYMCIDYSPGGDLFSLKKQRKFSIFDIKLIIAELSIALNDLHQRGIIYRDVKPENILIDKDGHIALTDFGISRVFGSIYRKESIEETYLESNSNEDFCNCDSPSCSNYEHCKTNTFCGTAEYIAPEMIRKESYGYMVDWWGVGILTYELLYGNTPFTGMNNLYIYQSILKKEPMFMKETDPNVVEFISKLLQKDPKERGDFEYIRNCSLFQDFDFKDVENKLIKPEIVPRIKNFKSTSYFNQKFTKEKPRDSIVDSEEKEYSRYFADFDYNCDVDTFESALFPESEPMIYTSYEASADICSAIF